MYGAEGVLNGIRNITRARLQSGAERVAAP